MDEVQMRFPQFTTLSQVLHDMVETTGFASVLAVLMLYIHYRGKLLVLSGFTVEITKVAQMAIVILELGKAKIKGLGDLCTLLGALSKLCMYASFGVIVYSCVTLGSK